MDEDRIIKSESTVVSIPAETSPTWIPTVTPTPTPVPAPTATSIPVFTEVPKEEVETVTEYKEEYRTAACRMSAKNETLMFETGIGKGRICRNSNQEECSGRNCKCTC